MKKFILLLLIPLLAVGVAKADVIVYNQPIWNSNDQFYDEVGITYDKFSSASGKTVRVYFTPCNNGGNLSITCKNTSNWATAKNVLNPTWQNNGTLYYDFKVSENTEIQNSSNQTFFYPGSTNVLASEASFSSEEGSSYEKSSHKLTTNIANTGFSYTLNSATYYSGLVLKTSTDARLTITVTYSDEGTEELSETSATTAHRLALDGTKQVSTINVKNQNTSEVTISSFDLYTLVINSVSLLTTTSLDKTTSSGTTSIYSGSHSLGNWNSLDLTGSSYITNKFSTAKLGDVIKVTFSTTQDGSIVFQKNGNLASKSVTSAATYVEYEIPDVNILSSIQSGGLYINGTNATITAVDLVTYSTSYDAVAVTIGEDKIATWSHTTKRDFTDTGIIAYYVSSYKKGSVTITPATNNKTWDYCGYILKGTQGTYAIPLTTGDGFYPSATWLQGNTSSNSIPVTSSREIDNTSTTCYNYIFAKNSSGVIGFYKLAADHTLAANKAYLSVPEDIRPTSPTSAPQFSIVYGDGQTTFINGVQERKVEDGIYYNLSGQRVQNPTKGLYIVNGKKVIIK